MWAHFCAIVCGASVTVEIGGSLSAAVDALGLKVERLSVAILSPGPVDICVETAATVVDGYVTAAARPVDLAVQTEGGLFVRIEFIDHVEHCVICKLLR